MMTKEKIVKKILFGLDAKGEEFGVSPFLPDEYKEICGFLMGLTKPIDERDIKHMAHQFYVESIMDDAQDYEDPYVKCYIEGFRQALGLYGL